MDRIPPDKFKLEALARMAATCLIAVTLSVANIPKAVPPSSKYMVGLWGTMLSTGFPRLQFALLAIIPSFVGGLILAMIFTTAILACYEISKALMVIVYAIYTVVISSFFFGRNYKKTSGLASVFCVIPGMLGVSFVKLLEAGQSVGSLWTEAGSQNPYAVFQNTLIVFCWAMFTIILGIVLPPPRTARRLMTKTILPSVAISLANYIGQDERSDNDEEIRRKIVHLVLSAMHGKAELTVFEPRLWRNENLVKPLDDLFREVRQLAKLTILKHVDYVAGGESYEPTVKILNLSARALQTNNPADYYNLKKYGDTLEEKNENDPSLLDELSYLTEKTFRRAKNVLNLTVNWLEDLNGDRGNALEGQAKNNSLWILLPFLPLVRLIELLKVVNPKRWELWKIFWVLKYAAGYVLFFSLSIYVPAWESFGIGTDQALYSGWHLLGYAFSWMPTVEGTAKRGVSRFCGTVLGGFCAWVGVITCSLSYSADGIEKMNKVAIVLWILFFVLFVSYFATDVGPSAMFGSSYDLGAFAKYFTLTLSLIMLEVEAEVGSKNEIIVNRIVATLTGVVMAVVFQLIPPNIKGNDFDRLQRYCDALKLAALSILDRMLDADPERDYEEQRKLYSAHKIGDLATYFAKDAGSLAAMPFFRLDARIIPLLEDMYVTETFAIELTKVNSERKVSSSFLRDYGCVLEALRSRLDSSSACQETTLDGDGLFEGFISAKEVDKARVVAAHNLFKRIEKHELVIAAIKAGELVVYEDNGQQQREKGLGNPSSKDRERDEEGQVTDVPDGTNEAIKEGKQARHVESDDQQRSENKSDSENERVEEPVADDPNTANAMCSCLTAVGYRFRFWTGVFGSFAVVLIIIVAIQYIP